VKHKKTSVGSRKSIGIRFTHINLSKVNPPISQCLDAEVFFHVIEDKTLGRVDPLMGRSPFSLQYPQGLKHSVRSTGERLASRSALVPPHLQGSVAVSRAIIP
jgi:hypothetical protein